MDDQYASSDDREIRAARNQALFRAINEKMYELNESFGDIIGTFAVACECADVQCVELLEIQADAYRHVRQNPRTFVVLAGHVYPDVERVVSSHDGYVIVEAIGHGAHHAEATFHLRRKGAVRDTWNRRR